jgi:hypothetical protein
VDQGAAGRVGQSFAGPSMAGPVGRRHVGVVQRRAGLCELCVVFGVRVWL